MDWTDAEIDHLISCRKSITDAPKKEMKVENRHRRNDMTLEGASGEGFEVFIRQSLDFGEDFSVGLVFLSKEGKRITLIRFNGQHEQSNEPMVAAKPHFNFHIHKATAENLNDGRYEKHPATVTTSYASLNEALAAFLDLTGVEGFQKYFPEVSSLPLFDYGRRAIDPS